MGAGPIALGLLDQYRSVRNGTEALVAGLSDADATVQSMEDASPAKWHLAHVTWFWETFILRDHVPGYAPFDPDYAYLFNSYYDAEGPRHVRPKRGMLTRPSLDRVLDYRHYVDEQIETAFDGLPLSAFALFELGLNHEQQHQELLLTDVKHLLAQNPLKPALWPGDDDGAAAGETRLEWISGKEGVVQIGHDGPDFAFDCEGPRHDVILTPHDLASRPVSNAEWVGFIEDGGYQKPEYWLSDGWAWVQREAVTAPLYWENVRPGEWQSFQLNGMRWIDAHAPVAHISLYEADAYARWAGCRLPTEAEWESAAQHCDPAGPGLREDSGPPRPHGAPKGKSGLLQMFGSVWEWTGSAYRPYPGFKAASGAVGEYNGKFMSGQFVLRGGSCATPRGHMRPSYRNFFHPHQRWQFTGLRLARDG
ncbi:MAG: ergothioneine biosynthesis protein EgtB [Sphingomonadales bacterium]|nr:ergothioneine biosynthesis protein EgtB [Sphingomonadales bacterium]